MIKTYCDKCKKECKEAYSTQAQTPEISFSEFQPRPLQVMLCRKCQEKFLVYIKKFLGDADEM